MASIQPQCFFHLHEGVDCHQGEELLTAVGPSPHPLDQRIIALPCIAMHCIAQRLRAAFLAWRKHSECERFRLCRAFAVEGSKEAQNQIKSRYTDLRGVGSRLLGLGAFTKLGRATPFALYIPGHTRIAGSPKPRHDGEGARSQFTTVCRQANMQLKR